METMDGTFDILIDGAFRRRFDVWLHSEQEAITNCNGFNLTVLTALHVSKIWILRHLRTGRSPVLNYVDCSESANHGTVQNRADPRCGA